MPADLSSSATPSSNGAHVAYRPDIDGLRAIAVSSVVIFHAFPTLLRGGFVGVDVFFIISGYLIGTIILGGLAAGTFRFSTFYARRVKRIFPALLLVLIACYGFGWFELLADEFKELGKQIAAGAGFVSNLALWQEAGYFDTAAETKPLLHLWSLGVEEQFYIFWPIALWLTGRNRRTQGGLIVIVGIASFALNVFTVGSDSVAAFYSPFSRFWELMMGCSLAFLTLERTTAAAKCGNFMSITGSLLIAASFAVVNSKSVFPGWWALLPTIGATLLIAAGPNAWVNRHVLSRKPFVWIGLISFPLYLWHWPLLVFARLVEGDIPAWSIRAEAVALSIVLATATYLLIEKPIRFGQRIPGRVAALCILMLGIGYAGVNAYQRDGLSFRITSMASRFTTTRFDTTKSWREHVCFLESGDRAEFGSACVDSGHGPLVFLWGDSFAAAISPGLRDLQSHYDFRLAQYTASGCPPLLPADARDPRCARVHQRSLAVLRETHPDLVILDANWITSDLANIKDSIAEIRADGVKNIVLVGPVPQWNDALPNVYWLYWRKNHHQILPPRSSFGLVAGISELDSEARNAAAAAGIRYVSALGVMCDSAGCLTRTGAGKGELTVFDRAHLTPAGARLLVDSSADQLLIPSVASPRRSSSGAM